MVELGLEVPGVRTLGRQVEENLDFGPTCTQTEDDEHPDDLSEVMDFSQYNLGTTIRLIVLSGESRRIEVKRGTKRGSIHIRAGEICRALTDEHVGDSAFFEILTWDRAVHRDCKETNAPEPNIRIATKVLLEAMKSPAYTKG
jgi:hypothetical protein